MQVNQILRVLRSLDAIEAYLNYYVIGKGSIDQAGPQLPTTVTADLHMAKDVLKSLEIKQTDW